MHLSKLSKTLVLTGLLALAGAASAQKTQLLVYTALETDQIKAYQEGFNKVNPDIEIKWVRDSTGVITAKLLAEKANPQADVVMGVAASSLALLDKQGMLIPYAPLNLDAIMSQYRDKKSPPAWFGMDVWGATVCFNTVEAKKKNIPAPETWQDLTKPVYKGNGNGKFTESKLSIIDDAQKPRLARGRVHFPDAGVVPGVAERLCLAGHQAAPADLPAHAGGAGAFHRASQRRRAVFPGGSGRRNWRAQWRRADQ